MRIASETAVESRPADPDPGAPEPASGRRVQPAPALTDHSPRAHQGRERRPDGIRAARTAAEFGRLWLSLMRALTGATSTWMVWKNADAVLAGIGDVDSAAAQAEWPTIARAFQAWARDVDVLPITNCAHIPGGMNLIAIPSDSATMLELGVKTSKTFRGSALFSIDDLIPLSELDPRGFRKLRPGAEGLFKLFLNGAKPGGRLDSVGMASKQVRDLIRADAEGVRRAAVLFGPVSASARAAARAAAVGDWDRRAVVSVEAWALVRGASHPGMFARRAWFRLGGRRSCPVVRALLGAHRRVPADRETWLREVAREHDLER